MSLLVAYNEALPVSAKWGVGFDYVNIHTNDGISRAARLVGNSSSQFDKHDIHNSAREVVRKNSPAYAGLSNAPTLAPIGYTINIGTHILHKDTCDDYAHRFSRVGSQ